MPRGYGLALLLSTYKGLGDEVDSQKWDAPRYPLGISRPKLYQTVISAYALGGKTTPPAAPLLSPSGRLCPHKERFIHTLVNICPQSGKRVF